MLSSFACVKDQQNILKTFFFNANKTFLSTILQYAMLTNELAFFHHFLNLHIINKLLWGTLCIQEMSVSFAVFFLKVWVFMCATT